MNTSSVHVPTPQAELLDDEIEPPPRDILEDLPQDEDDEWQQATDHKDGVTGARKAGPLVKSGRPKTSVWDL